MSTAIIQGATGGKSTIPTIPHFKDYALIFDARVNSVLAEPQNAASTLDLVTPTGKDSVERDRPDFQAQAIILCLILIVIGLLGNTITPSGQAHPSSRPSGGADCSTGSRGGKGDLGWEEGC
jgi:hypothetical protein